MSAHTSIVLVHGAWHGAWCWRRVLPLLRGAGIDTHAVTLTGVGERAHLLSRERIQLLKRGAGFINIGRAPIVDYETLRVRLDKGELGGAVLDVFDREPLSADSPWWTTRNTMVMPHVSCDDPRYIERLFDSWFVNFERFLAGKKLRNQVDRKLGY